MKNLWLVKRVLGILPVLVAITALSFLLIRLIPGDPVLVMLGDKATPEEAAHLRSELGLDRPLPTQFAHYLGAVCQGDLGRSITRNVPVKEELARAFPATLELSVAAMFLAVLIGVSLGAAAALNRNSSWEIVCSAVALGGVSIPIFWLGLLLLLIFPSTLGWFYFSGRTDAAFPVHTNLYLIDSALSGSFSNWLDVFGHLILPAVTLSTVPLAVIARMTRSSLLEVLGQDFIRTARAKGLSKRQVFFRHALKNALIPVLTIMGLQFGSLLGGAVLTETVFQWPGIGRLLVESVQTRDYPVVQGTILLTAVVFCLVNLMVDLAYAWIDPRVRNQ